MTDRRTFLRCGRIVAQDARGELPAIYNHREFVDAGGLMSYGPSIRAAHARAAEFADRILEGAHPGEVPGEPPARFARAINVVAAWSRGIAIPKALLLRALTSIQ